MKQITCLKQVANLPLLLSSSASCMRVPSAFGVKKENIQINDKLSISQDMNKSNIYSDCNYR